MLPEPARPVACPGTLGAPCLVFGSAVAVSKILNKFSAAPPPPILFCPGPGNVGRWPGLLYAHSSIQETSNGPGRGEALGKRG